MSRRALAVFTLISALILAAFTGTAHASHPSAAAGTVLGDYAGPLTTDAGGNTVDIPATIGKLSAAHVNTYAYLICFNATQSQARWNQLPDFLDAAQGAGIKVWVYLCPPSEAKDSSGNPSFKPYDWDYPAWAQHIAELSLTHPNLTAYAIDDFRYNIGSTYPVAFTPAYTGQMVAAGKAVNPNIKFYPVLYYRDMVTTTAFVGPYRGIVDGVIFPYRDESNGGTGIGPADTTNSANITSETKNVHQTVACPSGQHCYQVTFPASTPSTAGWGAGVQQQVSISPASKYTLSFTYADDFLAATWGYRFAEVTVNGTAVWSEDISGNRGQRHATVDLTSALAGKTSATIGLRVYDKKGVSNFHSTVTFDSVSTTGFSLANGGFENTSAWTPFQSSSVYNAGYANNLAVIDMVYASKLSSQPVPPTADYVEDASARALELVGDGYTSGTMTYVLNLTGADTATSYTECYDRIQSLYGSA
ncbi:MAG TPA: hypothetical protein VHC49_05290 [Mycobacteriales bacterium]|nr:hypothetical protein [Mycobacteriales bacterium]